MKKAFILVAACLSMIACKKEGYVYKANFMDKTKFYGGGDLSGSITTTFFTVNVKDSISAVNFYIKTEAYSKEIAKCDSFWVDYICTANEWKSKLN